MSMDVTTWLDAATKPYPFCPGCSHSIVLDRLAEALAMRGVPPDKVVLVSDIGCIGISDKHFKVHTFHGLHGRSITYATGLKLANPELTVFVLVGDGGIGIGGHHFLHAARRNVEITVLVCNNFNFGMTGGQHSVTTPHGAVTATTSVGNVEHPIDLTGLVAAAQGALAIRCLFSDPKLAEYIATAMATPGFAVLDIWEMCTAYYAKTNKVTRSTLEQQLRERGLGTGVVVRNQRPGYIAQYRSGLSELAGKPRSSGTRIETEFESRLSSRTSLLVAGRAGQKVRSSAITLGKAAVLSGLTVTQRDDYPVTVQTGHSTAELIFERGPIDALGAEVPDQVLITAAEGKEVIASTLSRLPETSVVYCVPELLPLQTRARVEAIPTAEMGIAKSKTGLVLGCLAWWAHRTGLASIEAVRRAVGLGARKSVVEESMPVVDAVEKAVAG
jgi:pyruvate/2-oxoacid:ferredoxin oxidoreductase beta subunit/Pyruvate/2-oxoacid:ferredoxin oxidoreductase gamma subunit